MNLTRIQPRNIRHAVAKVPPSAVFMLMMLGALVFFEGFNFSTTEFALDDLLGDLSFAGLPWATILAIAFCGIDFAGVARLMNPTGERNDIKETWYLFGAWLLAATMNAALTWWGVSMAIANHAKLSSAVVDPKTLVRVAPIFVALMVWVIRILIIGTMSFSLERYIYRPEGASAYGNSRPRSNGSSGAPVTANPAVSARPANNRSAIPLSHPINQPEPGYSSFSSSDTLR